MIAIGRGTRVVRAATCGLAWVLFLASPAPGGLRAQPFAPGPESPPPPGGQPFVPQPGAPPQTLPPQKIADITVRGNTNVPTDQVLGVVTTKVNDPLNEEKINSDVQAILNTGLFADAVVRLEPVPEGVRVVFVVVENPVISTVEVKGNTVISTGDILKSLGVQTGQVLNSITMRTGARAIEKLYQDRGYALARVSDIIVSPEGTLTVTLAEGRIEAITFVGLHKTKPYVVRRELTFKVGDVFNVNAVNASLKKLFLLKYFSDVKASPGPGSEPDTVNVTMTFTEQRTASIGFGAGYSTQSGLEAFVNVRDIDFGGNGQTLSIQYNPTVLNGSATGISFREPYFYGSHTAFDAQLFNVTTIPTNYTLGLGNQFQYNLTNTGGFFSLTQPLDAIHSINYGLKDVNSTFAPPTNGGTPPPPGFQFTPGAVVAPILGWAVDTRDDPNFPTSGERLFLAGEFGFEALGGNFTFQKLEADYSKYIPAGENTIVGHVHLGGAPQAMPQQEQFFLGGQTTLRGYPYERFQGDEEFLLQLEYHFPLSHLPLLSHLGGITGIVFGDTGNASLNGAGLGALFTLHSDFGFGIAVKTPFGPFRLDYGFSNEGGFLWVSTGVIF